MRLRQILLPLGSFGCIVASALMIWKMLIVATGTASPILVHRSSGNAQHGRGDLLFLSSVDAASPIRVGELIVYEVSGRSISVVHRVWRVHERFVETPTPQDLIDFSYCELAREIERGLYIMIRQAYCP